MTKILIGAAIIALAGIGWFTFFGQNANDVAMVQKGSTAVGQPNDAMAPKKDESAAMMAKAGSYEVYSPEKIAKAATGKVVLFFRAGWCPTCKALDADIRSHLKDIPADVTILDVDYDNSTALKQKYGVTYQHTLVQVDASGNQITKWSGGLTLAEFVTNIK
ncbi:thioredoxin family protein [Candidatus Kaiserbacteria bacterium]|nr:thioredoxin family protein [Candidatus Kaiserbacteria bacterium]